MADDAVKWMHRKQHPDQFEDGSQYLVAVQIVSERTPPYEWEYSVITIKADEGRFDIECNGESWGWLWEDVEFYIPLRHVELASIISHRKIMREVDEILSSAEDKAHGEIGEAITKARHRIEDALKEGL